MGNADSNLKVHVEFGYDYFFVDYNKNKVYGTSSWDGKCSKDLGKFRNEDDLKEIVGKAVGKNRDYYFNNPKKWDC